MDGKYDFTTPHTDMNRAICRLRSYFRTYPGSLSPTVKTEQCRRAVSSNGGYSSRQIRKTLGGRMCTAFWGKIVQVGEKLSTYNWTQVQTGTIELLDEGNWRWVGRWQRVSGSPRWPVSTSGCVFVDDYNSLKRVHPFWYVKEAQTSIF